MKTFGGQSPPGSGLGIPHPPGAYPGTPPRRQAATRPIIQAFFFWLLLTPSAFFLLNPTVCAVRLPRINHFCSTPTRSRLFPLACSGIKAAGSNRCLAPGGYPFVFFFVFLFGTGNRPSCQIMLFVCFFFTASARWFRRF